jgi:phytanoyl-CoA hydroxylase
MEDLAGPEIIASSAWRLRTKIPNFGYGEVPWHQDSAYLNLSATTI